MGTCYQFAWWCLDASAWAAWAQALLTVATFVGTVIYQAKRDMKATLRLLQAEHDRLQEEIERKELVIAASTLLFSRQLRGLKRRIDEALRRQYSSNAERLDSYKAIFAESPELVGDDFDPSIYGSLAADIVQLATTFEVLAEQASVPHGKDEEACKKLADEVEPMLKQFVEMVEPLTRPRLGLGEQAV
jgi:hypothetical protein